MDIFSKSKSLSFISILSSVSSSSCDSDDSICKEETTDKLKCDHESAQIL